MGGGSREGGGSSAQAGVTALAFVLANVLGPAGNLFEDTNHLGDDMKKLLLVLAAAVAGAVVKKRIDAANQEQALWHEATDPVSKA